jgi:hypothetical protein
MGLVLIVSDFLLGRTTTHTEKASCSEAQGIRNYALLMGDVTRASSQRAPSYAEIMNLDERIRRMSRSQAAESKPACIPFTSTCMQGLLCDVFSWLFVLTSL